MSNGQKLILEVINGPLDGAVLVLTADAEWSRTGEGPLCFLWDAELGAPQARFRIDDGGWAVEACQAPHGTYRINTAEKITGSRSLQAGDLLKASATWLLVRAQE
jgi:hypothetical protein